MYQNKILESAFIGVINKKGYNIIVECVYLSLPLMDSKEFNELFLKHLLENPSYENKFFFSTHQTGMVTLVRPR